MNSPVSGGDNPFPRKNTLDANNIFTGKSTKGDFKEALSAAIYTAKDKLKSNDIEWILHDVSGRDSDFIADLTVTIEAVKSPT